MIKPVTRTSTELDALKSMIADVRGHSLVSVKYGVLTPPGWTGSTGALEDLAIDSVYLDFASATSAQGKTSLRITWAMNGVIEGLSITLAGGDSLGEGVHLVDMTAAGPWSTTVGLAVEAVGLAWHRANAGSPLSVWGIRFSLSDRRILVIALGSMQGGIAEYLPDELVVFFDEESAASYRPLASISSAMGVLVLPS